MKSVVFGDVDCADYGLVSESKIDNAPAKVYEEVVVPGKNGVVYLDTGRYENVEQIYNGVIYTDYEQNVQDLRNALYSQVGYQRLEDNINNDEYYIAILKSNFEPQQTNDRAMGTYQIKFERKPQRFLKSGETSQTFTSDGEIENPTEFPSKPLIVISGKGVVGIGDYTMTIRGLDEQEIYIDCESMEAWEMVGGAKVSRNDYIQYMGNSFPVIKAGTNGISLGSGINSVEITPRWWRL